MMTDFLVDFMLSRENILICIEIKRLNYINSFQIYNSLNSVYEKDSINGYHINRWIKSH